MDAKLEQKARDEAVRVMEGMPKLQELLEARHYNDVDEPLVVEVGTDLLDAVMYEVRDTIIALTHGQGGVGFVVVPEPLVRFLLGEDSFGGVWFGDPKPGTTARWWWRENLRELAARPGAEGGGE